MQLGLSLYLDLLRFLLALTVMFGHASDPSFVGTQSFLQGFPRYGLTAVTGFFVLSGLVIAHVSGGSEKDPRRYVIARAARLYSVVLPALALTAIVDTVGAHFSAQLYAAGPIHIGSHQPLRYLLTSLFAQNFWLWHREMTPGVNHPFWTLSYEATYYLVFGLLLTRRPIVVIAGGVLTLLLVGPKIAMLMPIWFLGVLTYYALKRYTLPQPWALALFVASVVGIYLAGAQRLDDDNIIRYDSDYAEALLFSCNMFAAGSLAPLLQRFLGRKAALVRWLGMLTFALYLCHRPLLYFFSALRVAPIGHWWQTAWLFGMTLLVVVIMAHLGEWLRVNMRAWLAALPWWPHGAAHEASAIAATTSRPQRQSYPTQRPQE